MGEIRNKYHDLTRDEVFPIVPKNAGKLLDFGGGRGDTALKLKELGYAGSVGVIDIVPVVDQSPKLDFRFSGNVEDPAVLNDLFRREGPFDTILCLDILEHLRSPWDVVRMLHSALAPSGCIVASIPNIRNYRALFPLLFRNKWELRDSGILDRTHLRFFVESTAIELMTSSGLVLDHVSGIPNGGRKIKLIRAMTLGLLNSFTNRQYLVRVHKPD